MPSNAEILAQLEKLAEAAIAGATIHVECDGLRGMAFLNALKGADFPTILAALKQRVAELERELAAARKVASCLHDFATAHEKWEAALIMDDAAWSGGMAAWPTLNETLYAGMMELQRQRAAALVTYDLAAYRATKEPRDEKAK